jgi:hypothetical protein
MTGVDLRTGGVARLQSRVKEIDFDEEKDGAKNFSQKHGKYHLLIHAYCK